MGLLLFLTVVGLCRTKLNVGMINVVYNILFILSGVLSGRKLPFSLSRTSNLNLLEHISDYDLQSAYLKPIGCLVVLLYQRQDRYRFAFGFFVVSSVVHHTY